MNKRFFLLYALLPLFFSGCGYRVQSAPFEGKYATISVPYIDGDERGAFTASIIQQVATKTPLSYCSDGGDLVLNVQVLDTTRRNIGFRYAHKKHGKRTRSVVPTENRLTKSVECRLVEASSGHPIAPPVLLNASYEFDFNYNHAASKQDTVHFSLGQLCDADDAFEIAEDPLNEILAEKIADYINAL